MADESNGGGPKPYDLSRRFALAGGGVMLLAMLVIGSFVSQRIEQSVIDNTASATALFMDSFIAPLAQELETADTLSIGPIRAIEEMLSGSALGQRVVAVKIWKPDGRVAYSDDATLIGKAFPPTDSLTAALGGRLVAEFNHLGDAENASERSKDLPLLEIYSPLRQVFSGKILGVVEFYENASALEGTLAETRVQAWFIVALVTLGIGASLFGIVHRGSLLIAEQQRALETRIAETERVATQNRQLRLDIERAARGFSELNERLLRRVSADLHDGPAQLIGLAALRLDSAVAASDPSARQTELAAVRGALADAMREIRDLCSDLSLPEIDPLTIADIIGRIANAHRLHTGTEVAVRFSGEDRRLPQSIGICAYRFVQETLNNAWRHAGGAGQSVDAALDRDGLTIIVANAAGTALPGLAAERRAGLGLTGLKKRVESLGGQFAFSRTEAGGAEARLRLGFDSGGPE